MSKRNTVLFSLLLPTIILFGCAADRAQSSAQTKLLENEHIYWVDSLKKPCSGVAPMQCLQVQRADEMSREGWTLFYDSISGFDYEQGYRYKLVVQEIDLPKEQVPADGSSKKYILSQILEKNFDRKILLDDTWRLTAINGEPLPIKTNQKHPPQLEINLQKMQLSGNNGCNNFFGSIRAVDSETLHLGPLASTRKACIDMTLPDKFDQNIQQVDRYTIEEQTLTLFDKAGDILLTFHKTD